MLKKAFFSLDRCHIERLIGRSVPWDQRFIGRLIGRSVPWDQRFIERLIGRSVPWSAFHRTFSPLDRCF